MFSARVRHFLLLKKCFVFCFFNKGGTDLVFTFLRILRVLRAMDEWTSPAILLTFLSCLWSCVHMYISCSSQYRECFGYVECFSCSHARRTLANPPVSPLVSLVRGEHQGTGDGCPRGWWNHTHGQGGI